IKIMKYRRPNKPTDLSERAKLVSMWVDGISCRNIARQTGKSVSTVCRWITRWKREGNVNTKPRIGRPFKTRILHTDMTISSLMFALISLLIVREYVSGPVNHMAVLAVDSVYEEGVTMAFEKGGFAYHVSEMVGQVVEQHLAGCHLVLVDTTQSPLFSIMIRQLVSSGESVMVVEAWRMFLYKQVFRNESVSDWNIRDEIVMDQLARDQLLQGLFLEWCEVWRRPEIPVVVVGERDGVETVLLHHSLRNTIHTLYLALHDLPLHRGQGPSLNMRSRKKNIIRGSKSEQVWLYGRCLYCKKGDAQVQLLHRGNLTYGLQLSVNLFPEHLGNFLGHTFQLVVNQYLPFIDIELDKEPGTPVAPRDSLNTRMLHTIASSLNFTYVKSLQERLTEVHHQVRGALEFSSEVMKRNLDVKASQVCYKDGGKVWRYNPQWKKGQSPKLQYVLRQPLDEKWGTPADDGNWTGIVGDLQHQKADFSLDLTLSESRSRVMDHSRVYNYDPYIILSLKPSSLPRHLSLTRPFKGEVWMSITVCTSVLGIILWLLQMAWSWASAYRSSLIAHLSVQSKYPPINTFQDLLDRDDWSWGSNELIGTNFLYFNGSSDPDVQEIYKNME
ncbi:Glutamate receptor-like 23, partial [Homarus americanus]